MPDIRKHRGAHPEDRKLFAVEQLPGLRTAVHDLSWLLTNGYTMKAALKLVGDRYELTERQRLAISRAACSNQSQQHRWTTSLPAESITGSNLIIDGFNLIITIEAALSSGLLIASRDGCIRDSSSVHGSYRSVSETTQALQTIAEELAILRPAHVHWILDRPISNSGRLAQRIRNLADERNAEWTVETAFNPDAKIIASGRIVISADGPLLDRVPSWINFTRQVVEKRLADSWVIDLSC